MKDDKKTFPVMVWLHHLQDLGIKEVQMGYEGGGDNGAIEQIDYLDAQGNEVEDPLEDKDQVEEIGYRLLKQCGDWINNDGGWGTIKIKVPSGEYEIDGNLRVNEVEDDSHSGELKDYYIDESD